ncbi:Gtr1/RagA G protein conserved region-domain-containing protein [Annulohypoxylon maeteangense]|uniref:Gtr1/RagA G protein conserved region-domain-containing protein n=1 Tax=Annulohypoxylon maeteangense TaxID=1927788 RepID=UPI002007DB0F|nr:Gtr1/RagA G protein conserved region-domain-containing protein [Annulohypoxylon maeteangense]KAI0883042.1 Gtr1/RagA G protein conserved region-domain-containing protein [Annulohypoxylon maeteangense]
MTDLEASTPSLGLANDIRNEVKKPKKKKVLLMGKSGSGKSSMRSIIFSNYIARDTRRLGATIDIDLSHVKFLGNLTLNLWDCGGQEAFMENYLSQQRVHVFSNVGVLIYVFDIESRDVDRDMATYVSIISALTQFSPTAKVYVLIHKMDLITPLAREAVFVDRVKLVRQKTSEYIQGIGYSGELELIPFATSIWDQSLYKAWASIIHDLVPNLSVIESQLGSLGVLIEAEELLLFERTSFLVVSNWTSQEGQNNPTGDRQERISNILKHFKQSISRFTGTPRNAEQFTLMEHKAGSRFSMFACKFTTNTYLMVILPPGEARFNSAKLNCQIARESFKFLDGPVIPGPGQSYNS